MIWTIAYWVLLVLGVLVGLRALFWDRAGFRGRAALRCRKCWYDLTAAPGDIKEKPIMCSECGKKHASRRAMRKTRRSKRWVVIALVLVFGSHSIRVTPKVKERGWWAAVPSWVLILSIHQAPRHIQNPDVEWSSIAYGRKSLLQRALGNLHWRARVDGLNWFDYQFVAWLARTETEELLCQNDRSRYDGVSPRAANYCILIEQGLERGQLGSWHREWFSRLFAVEVNVRSQWPERARVYAQVHTRMAYRNRVRNSWVPGLRARVDAGWSSSLIRRAQMVDWEVDPFPVGGYRNVQIRHDAGEDLQAIRNRVWSDGKIPVMVSKKGLGKLQVDILKVSGYQGAPHDREELLRSQDVEFHVVRQGTIEDYVTVIDDESVQREIERCIAAKGVYWHDVDGRWHAMFQLELVEQPRLLGERRYTFGSNAIRSISSNEELAGQAWWALEPDPDGGWRLIHEKEYVPMFGWIDESVQGNRFPNLRNLSIKPKPAFCLRDDEAKTIIGSRLRFKIEWNHARVYVN